MFNTQKVSYSVILYLTLFLNSIALSYSEEKQIFVVFRYDDYSSLSSTELETKLIESFRKFNISCVFGVVPFAVTKDCHSTQPQDLLPLTPEKIILLKKGLNDAVIEVAQHGYSHQTVTLKRYTEFAGIDYNEQYKKIEKGKLYLENKLGVEINSFIPPWNTYDLNTLNILEDLKFNSILIGTSGNTKESSLKFLPATCSLFNLKDAVKEAMESSDLQPFIGVLFHQYDFQGYNSQNKGLKYEEFEKLLEWITSQKNVRILSVAQAVKSIEDLSCYRLENSMNLKRLSSFLPKSFYPEKSSYYFLSNYSNKLKSRGWVLVLIFNIAIIFVSFILSSITYKFFTIKPDKLKYIFLLVLIILFSLIVYSFLKQSLSLPRLIGLDILIGLCAGTYKMYSRFKAPLVVIEEKI